MSIAGAPGVAEAALVTAQRFFFETEKDGALLAQGLITHSEDLPASAQIMLVEEPGIPSAPADTDSAEILDDGAAAQGSDGAASGHSELWVPQGVSLTWVNQAFGSTSLDTVSQGAEGGDGPLPLSSPPAVVPLPAAIWTGGMMLAALAGASVARRKDAPCVGADPRA